MEEMKCSTCLYWTGTHEDDVAGCTHPLPLWVSRILEYDASGDYELMAGDIRDCPCWFNKRKIR